MYNAYKVLGNAAFIGLFICHCQETQAGWTGLINGAGFGWARVSVTSSTLVSGSVNTPNVTGPAAAMAPVSGYTYTGPLPSGSSVNTVARVKGGAGYIWQANAVGVNGDKADSDFAPSVIPTTSDATTMLEVLSVTSVPDSSCGTGGATYTVTWHWSGSDAGTAQQIQFFEFDGPPDSLPNNLNDFLDVASPLSDGPITVVGSSGDCEGFCPPGFDEVRSFSFCTTDISKIYMVTGGTAESLPGCVTGFFRGFLPPIGGADATGGNCSAPVGTFKSGRTIPVKLTLDCNGAPVPAGNHTLWLSQCGSGTLVPASSTDAATIGNLFRKTGDHWQFNLSTQGLSTGTWELIAILYDGTAQKSTHAAYIEIGP